MKMKTYIRDKHGLVLYLVGAVISFALQVAPSVAGQVVLWNKLGSDQEVANSPVGPGGSVHNGPLVYLPGKFGNGFSSPNWNSGIDFGSWYAINPDFNLRGTVAFWWKPASNYNEGGPDEQFVYGVWGDPMPHPFELIYRWSGEQNPRGFEFQFHDSSGQWHQLQTGQVIPFVAGEWVHVAYVYDMNGLPGYPDVWYGIYLNGQYYPFINVNNPGGTINFSLGKPNPALLSLGYYTGDYQVLNGVMDNFVVYDYAKTDFSDRFKENPVDSEAQHCDLNSNGRFDLRDIVQFYQACRVGKAYRQCDYDDNSRFNLRDMILFVKQCHSTTDKDAERLVRQVVGVIQIVR